MTTMFTYDAKMLSAALNNTELGDALNELLKKFKQDALLELVDVATTESEWKHNGESWEYHGPGEISIERGIVIDFLEKVVSLK